jgi:DNA repair photolyase
MRWDQLRLDATPQAPLPLSAAVERTIDTPGFAGITFYEVQARSALNRVPPASRVPFRWTVNPYRGCTHACVYCFARQTHTYLDLDAGIDFDTRVVVKVNVVEVLRRELASPRWSREHVALGTNVDPYQRAEGRYRLMPGILAALRDASTPFSVLSKGTLVLGDLGLLADCAERVEVSVAVSVGSVDRDLARLVEPGAPPPQARLDACAALSEAGLGCGVLMAPVLPHLTDSASQLEATVAAIATAGATNVTPIALHLRPGAREWWFAWLREHRPDLVRPYERLFAKGAYISRDYQRRLAAQVADIARAHGLPREPARRLRPPPARTHPRDAPAEQLSLVPEPPAEDGATTGRAGRPAAGPGPR